METNLGLDLFNKRMDIREAADVILTLKNPEKQPSKAELELLTKVICDYQEPLNINDLNSATLSALAGNEYLGKTAYGISCLNLTYPAQAEKAKAMKIKAAAELISTLKQSEKPASKENLELLTLVICDYQEPLNINELNSATLSALADKEYLGKSPHGTSYLKQACLAQEEKAKPMKIKAAVDLISTLKQSDKPASKENLELLTLVICEYKEPLNINDLKLVTLNALACKEYLGKTPDGKYCVAQAYLAQHLKTDDPLSEEFSALEKDYEVKKVTAAATPANDPNKEDPLLELDKEHLFKRLTNLKTDILFTRYQASLSKGKQTNDEWPSILKPCLQTLGRTVLSEAAHADKNASPHAKYREALMFKNGTDGEYKQIKLGTHLLNSADKSVTPDTKYKLAFMYIYGTDGEPEQHEFGMSLLTQAEENTSADEKYKLALTYLDGNDKGSREFEFGMRIIRKAAVQGSLQARTLLREKEPNSPLLKNEKCIVQ